MEWNNKLFLADDEIKLLSIYLAYGVLVGIIVGMFLNNVQLFFSLGGVISILLSLVIIFIKRNKKSEKIHIN